MLNIFIIFDRYLYFAFQLIHLL